MNKKFEVLYVLSLHPEMSFSDLHEAVEPITGQNRPALSAMMGMYKSVDLVDQDEHGKWFLTDAGEMFVKAQPEYEMVGGKLWKASEEDTLKDTPQVQDTPAKPPPEGPVTDQATIERLQDPSIPAAGIVIPVAEPAPVFRCVHCNEPLEGDSDHQCADQTDFSTVIDCKGARLPEQLVDPEADRRVAVDLEVYTMSKLVDAMEDATRGGLPGFALDRISRWFLERYGNED